MSPYSDLRREMRARLLAVFAFSPLQDRCGNRRCDRWKDATRASCDTARGNVAHARVFCSYDRRHMRWRPWLRSIPHAQDHHFRTWSRCSALTCRRGHPGTGQLRRLHREPRAPKVAPATSRPLRRCRQSPCRGTRPRLLAMSAPRPRRARLSQRPTMPLAPRSSLLAERGIDLRARPP